MPQSTNTNGSPVPAPQQPLASWYAQGMSDGLGDRLLMFDNSEAPSLELLRFRQDLAQAPGFETALREQVRRLARFEHPAFARVRAVQRLEPDDDLALISNHTPGKRLSEVLHRARGPAAAAALIRQLAPALTQFQQQHAGAAHGLLNPDRIVVSPEGRLTIVEHVVGPAIDSLDLGTLQLSSIGIALPPGGPARRLDAATDWYQLGLVAVSVLLGRPVTASDLPQLETLLDRVADSVGPDATPLSPFVREWLDRVLRLSNHRIESGADGRAALDEMLQKEQPRDSRRAAIPAARHEEPPPAPRVNAAAPEPVAVIPPEAPAMPREAEAVEPADAATPRPAAVEAQPAPIAPEPAPLEPAAPPMPSEPATVAPPVSRTMFEMRPTAARPRAAQPRVVTEHDTLSQYEREVLSGKGRRATEPSAYDRPSFIAPAPPPPVERRSRSTALVAALALLAVIEAGAIAWLARAVWFAPAAPVSVEADATGERVRIASPSAAPAPLQLAAAPDLSWVSVTSPYPEGILGGTVTDTTSGTIRISSPIPLKVLSGSRVLGSVPGADLKLVAGRHEIELVNAPLGYRSTQVIQVEAGQTLSLHIAPPHGWVTIDASPWAEVSIDGKAVGRTPLGPLPISLGEHQVTFQHPTGGGDRQRVTVKAGDSTRVVGKLR